MEHLYSERCPRVEKKLSAYNFFLLFFLFLSNNKIFLFSRPGNTFKLKRIGKKLEEMASSYLGKCIGGG